MEIGNRSESRKHIFFLRDCTQFIILKELKKNLNPRLKMSKYTHTHREKEGERRVYSLHIQVPFATVCPIISVTLSRAALCSFVLADSKSMKTLKTQRKETLGVGETA